MPRSYKGLLPAPGYDQQCFSDAPLLLIYPVFEELWIKSIPVLCYHDM